jgi:hypothetical protein
VGQVFHAFDVDESGELDTDELRDLFVALHPKISRDDLSACIRCMSGYVDPSSGVLTEPKFLDALIEGERTLSQLLNAGPKVPKVPKVRMGIGSVHFREIPASPGDEREGVFEEDTKDTTLKDKEHRIKKERSHVTIGPEGNLLSKAPSSASAVATSAARFHAGGSATMNSDGTELFTWLLYAAEVNESSVALVLGVLQEEGVECLKDLHILAGLPHFETCGIKALDVAKIRKALTTALTADGSSLVTMPGLMPSTYTDSTKGAFTKGDAVLYRTGHGTQIRAEIVHVLTETTPHCYTIRYEGLGRFIEKQTEEHRLAMAPALSIPEASVTP